MFTQTRKGCVNIQRINRLKKMRVQDILYLLWFDRRCQKGPIRLLPMGCVQVLPEEVQTWFSLTLTPSDLLIHKNTLHENILFANPS